jgi:hypothetical protein
MGLINAWSYSRLSVYRKCPRQFKYKFVDKLQEPESEAMARGNAIHLALQLFIEKKAKSIPKEMKASLGAKYSDLLVLRNAGAKCELEWAVDKDWQPVSWFAREAWLRAKLDAFVVLNGGTTLDLTDHKSGKIYTEPHAEQLEIYAAVGYAFHPEVEEIIARMLYIDQGQSVPSVFTDLEKTIPKLRKKWSRIAAPLFKDKAFKATPGRECNSCHFSSRRGGPCDKG